MKNYLGGDLRRQSPYKITRTAIRVPRNRLGLRGAERGHDSPAWYGYGVVWQIVFLTEYGSVE